MKDVNKVILVGRLGKDPVQRETRNGTSVVNFPLATSRRIRDAGAEPATDGVEPVQFKEETQWHRVYVWGKEGAACAQYLRKGNSAFVEGSIRTRKYTGKDGEDRYMFEIHAESVSFLGGSGMRTVEMGVAAEAH